MCKTCPYVILQRLNNKTSENVNSNAKMTTDASHVTPKSALAVPTNHETPMEISTDQQPENKSVLEQKKSPPTVMGIAFSTLTS